MDEKGLGKRLQEVRREKGMTQQELCQKAKLSYSTLAKIERGAIKSPSVFTILAIANVLGVSLEELLGIRGGSTGQPTGRTKSGVSFVYFDVNGCLVRGYQRAFTLLAEATGALPDVIESTYWHYNDEVCRGTMSVSDFDTVMARRLNAMVDWQSFYLQAVEPITEMQDILVEAAQRYPVGLLTNVMSGFLTALRSRGLLPDINYAAVVDSSEVGEIKPGRKIYEIAEERAGRPGSEILFIDDTRNNLLAAEQMGWHVLQFDATVMEDSLEKIRSSLEPA
jgi:FMN phosphatase YigB (HAD superfamily)/DNA-binding XRE family transcriptional regulator